MSRFRVKHASKHNGKLNDAHVKVWKTAHLQPIMTGARHQKHNTPLAKPLDASTRSSVSVPIGRKGEQERTTRWSGTLPSIVRPSFSERNPEQRKIRPLRSARSHVDVTRKALRSPTLSGPSQVLRGRTRIQMTNERSTRTRSSVKWV